MHAEFIALNAELCMCICFIIYVAVLGWDSNNKIDVAVIIFDKHLYFPVKIKGTCTFVRKTVIHAAIYNRTLK